LKRTFVHSLAVILIGCGALSSTAEGSEKATIVASAPTTCGDLLGTWRQADTSARRGWKTVTFGSHDLFSTTLSTAPTRALTGGYTCVSVPVNSEEIAFVVTSPSGMMAIEVGTGKNRPGGRITWYSGLRTGETSEDEDLVKT
jgi:hypothetical protein